MKNAYPARVDFEQIEREIRLLKDKVRRLSKEIRALGPLWIEDPSPVERLLKMRGLKVYRKNRTDRLFFPSPLPPLYHARFYELMKRYSFRLVLRDMVKYQQGFREEELTHYCSAKVVRQYSDLLLEMGMIVEEEKGRYRTAVSPLASFGPTLEWFIAEMFRTEFASPAIYGVSLKETVSGGDYDVISAWNNRLLLVEVKSSPPRGIEIGEISTFFSRFDELLPDLAILFNDTQLRMRDKLVVLFEEELGRRHGKRSTALYPVERLHEELFQVNHRIFIINSRKDVMGNVMRCLKDYLRHESQGSKFRR
jgi:hypothetical protein